MHQVPSKTPPFWTCCHSKTPIFSLSPKDPLFLLNLILATEDHIIHNLGYFWANSHIFNVWDSFGALITNRAPHFSERHVNPRLFSVVHVTQDPLIQASLSNTSFLYRERLWIIWVSKRKRLSVSLILHGLIVWLNPDVGLLCNTQLRTVEIQ